MSDQSTLHDNKDDVSTAKPKKKSLVGRIGFLILTLACFAYLYGRLNGAAARDGMDLASYMADVFATVNWAPWLLLMVGYSLFYFAVDTLVVTRALNWFVADIKYKDIAPIRASAYIFLFSTSK